MTRSRLLALAALAVTVSCVHITVITGAPPSDKQIDSAWQRSFVFGFVPPADISTKDICPKGIARYDSERSFLNGLVSVVTLNIYTPVHTTITCAAGPVVR